LKPECVPLLLEAARNHKPPDRHKALVGFLNLGVRAGALDAMIEGLKSEDIRTKWCDDNSRNAREWQDEIDRWAEHLAKPNGKKTGIKFLRESGFTIPSLPNVADRDVPTADKIPAPTGGEEEPKSYTDNQISELLGLNSFDCVSITSQVSLAYRLEKYQPDLRHSSGLGYVTFNGRQWTRDAGSKPVGAYGAAEKIARVVKAEAAHLFNLTGVLTPAPGRAAHAKAMSEAATNHLKFARNCESHQTIKAALELARSHIQVPRDKFEPKSFVLGFADAVWDRGEIREHRRDDFMLEISPVSILEPVDRAAWNEVLDAMTNGDKDFQATLQDVAGATAAAANLKKVPVLFGPNDTGKTIYVTLISTVLGNQATSIDTKQLEPGQNRGRFGAAIFGKRFISVAEAGGARISSELVKTASGGDQFPVQFHYQETVVANPFHMLVMVCNDPPHFSDSYGPALRSRVIALPFLHRLDGAGADGKATRSLLKGENLLELARDPNSDLVRGFTAWVIDGMHNVMATGAIYEAEIVKEHTAQFWGEADPLKEFWAEMKEVDFKAGVSKAALSGKYALWAKSNDLKPFSSHKFNAACRARGLVEGFSGEKDARVKVWREPVNRIDEKREKSVHPENAVLDSENRALTEPVNRFDPKSQQSLRKIQNSYTCSENDPKSVHQAVEHAENTVLDSEKTVNRFEMKSVHQPLESIPGVNAEWFDGEDVTA
jgi:phage/plasmid-associated DNA primase